MPRQTGPRKPTAKQLLKQKQKDEKTRKKNEQTFANAVQNSKSTILDVDMRYVMDTLRDNPSWISPLAGLIRSGSLNGLLKEVAAKDEVGGLKWKAQGKCSKWGQLPLEMCLLMLRTSGVELSERASKEQDVVRTLFAGHFWVAESAPLPTRSDLRYQSTLVKLAKARLEHAVHRNWAGALNAEAPLDHTTNRLKMWSLNGNTLVCHVFSVDEDENLSKDWKPGQELEHELPKLPDGQDWKLSDAHSPDCTVCDGQVHSMFDFDCASFFPMLPDFKEKWNYDLPADTDTMAMDGGLGGSSESSLHFGTSSFSDIQLRSCRKRKTTSQDPGTEETNMDLDTDTDKQLPGDEEVEKQSGSTRVSDTRVSEFSTSTFATVLLLFHWQQGMRKDAKWRKHKDTVVKLAGDVLQAFASLFLVDHTSVFTWEEQTTTLVFQHGSLDVKQLHKQCPVLQSTISTSRPRFLQVLEDVALDCSKRTISQKRRAAALRLRCFLLETLTAAVETSESTHSCWTSLNVKQLLQLRSAAGYRRSSHVFKESMTATSSATQRTLVSTLEGHTFTVEDTPTQDAKNAKKKTSMDAHRLTRMERYAYLQDGKQQFFSTDILCVVADALHVGSEDWLNIMVYNHTKGKVWICPPQVQDHSSCLTAEEWTNMWSRASQKFLDGDKTRGSAHEDTEERVSTLQWMQDINHGLKPLGWSFGRCQLRAHGQPFRGSEDSTRGSRAPIIILCTDQESTQLAAVAFLRNKKNLWVEHVSDPAHRSHNDVALAMSGAGLLKFAQWCISLYNIRYGPWQKGTWSKKIQQTAQHMKDSMDPSDPVLLMFFEDILLDAGLPLDNNTEETRRAWLQTLPELDCIRTKGTKASKSRFNSLTTAHAALDKEWSVLALVLTVCCLEHKWTLSAKDLFTQDSNQARASLTHGGSKSSAVKEAKDSMNEARQGNANSLHTMTKFIILPDNKTTARLVFLVLQPEQLRCSRMLEELRSSASTLAYYSEWSHWSWMTTAKEHLQTWSNLDKLARLGLDLALSRARPPDEEELVWQDTLALQMTRLTHQILRLRAGAQLYHTCGFGATAGLVHSDPGFRRSSLDYFKEMDECIKDTQRSGSLRAKQLLAGHFSHGQISQYLLAELQSTRFDNLTEEIDHVLRSIWSGLLNTKIIEDCNKVQREAEQRHGTAKDLGHLDGWKSVSTSGLVKMYKREEAITNQLHHTPADFNLTSLFSKTTANNLAKRARRSTKSASAEMTPAEIQEAQLLADVTKRRDWASHNHSEEQEVLAAYSLLRKAWRAKTWQLCEEGWCSGLLPEGHAVLAGESPLFIVRSYRVACLAWPGKIVHDAGSDFFEFDMTVSSLYWMHSTSVDTVVLKLQAASPLRVLAMICESMLVTQGFTSFRDPI
ncbi:unnamed protein product [Symbiodinium sp. CCMP2592]|nr:unnamed protein product [Symbiodinium sp. CCMP2592]